MSEHDEQAAVIDYCDAKSIPVFAIPNASRRSPAAANYMKAEGLRPGVPDLCIPRAHGEYHSLYIEMKHGRGKPTEEQVRWIHALRAEGMAAFVCYGASNAIACIDWYMSL